MFSELSNRVKSNLKIEYIGILLFGLLALIFLNLKADQYDESAVQRYLQFSSVRAKAVAKEYEDTIHQIYTNMRTISFLPAMEEIERHGKNFNAGEIRVYSANL